ncbi:hypothetical protein ABFS83_02G140800 [Erythranthe nasuta]
MASLNPFDLLDDDAEDPSLLIAAQQQKIEALKTAAPAAKPAAGGKDLPSQNKVTAQPRLPSKPTPPAQAVRESKSEFARGGQGGGGRGYGRGGRGYGGGGGGSYRDSPNNESSYDNRKVSANPDEADSGKTSERRGGGYIVGGSRSSFRGGRRGGFSNGDAGEGEGDRPRRPLDRRSGTGRGNEFKREGAGRGNWGTHTDELAEVTEEAVIEGEKAPSVEKPSGEVDATADGDKEAATTEVEEKEPEDKEMTLEEYEKVLEEKRKSLLALKADSEARKVDVKEFETMQQLSSKKKSNDDIFIKLGSEKDKKKELAEKEERAKKSVSINEFLKPAEGERHYSSGGRGRGRGRGSRGGGGYGGEGNENVRAPAIEDPGQFPTLGGKK